MKKAKKEATRVSTREETSPDGTKYTVSVYSYVGPDEAPLTAQPSGTPSGEGCYRQHPHFNSEEE